MVEVTDDTIKKETLLKGHRIHLRKRSEIAREVSRLKSKNKRVRDVHAIVSLNSIFKKARQRTLDLKRTAANNKNNATTCDKSYKLLFVVRNRRGVESSSSRSTLQLMGLSRVNTGRFFSNSESNLKNIRRIKPFVYYGTPTLRNVRELLHKRGTVIMPNGETKLLNSNTVVEDYVGDTDVLCISDVVEAIYKGSEAAEDILTKLGALYLSASINDGPLKHGDIGPSINETLELLT